MKTLEADVNHLTSHDIGQCSAAQTEELFNEKFLNMEPEVHIEKISISASRFEVKYLVRLPHGVRKLRVEKDLNDAKACAGFDISKLTAAFSNLNVDPSKCEKLLSDAYIGEVMSLPGFTKIVESLTYLDVEYVHTYSEGPEMTLADLILFAYVYFFLVRNQNSYLQHW